MQESEKKLHGQKRANRKLTVIECLRHACYWVNDIRIHLEWIFTQRMVPKKDMTCRTTHSVF